MRIDPDIAGEQWRPIPGWEGLYEISDHGRVRSWRKGNAKLAAPALRKLMVDADGYQKITLYLNRKGKGAVVGRLVLSAFKHKPRRGAECSHLNHDPADNRLENLIWESRLKNERRKSNAGRRPSGEDNTSAKLTADQIKEIRSRPIKRGSGRSLAREI